MNRIDSVFVIFRLLHQVQKQFQEFIDRKNLITPEDKVLLAVSGGLDSMVMLELFRLSDISFIVAHCNFGLRGEESDGDEQLVRQYCAEQGIECFVKQIQIEGSVQLEAREKRYQWFEELSNRHDFQKVATAHHLNDSLETTLFNLARGTGIKGLAGIPAKNGKIIRPLLFAAKEQLQDFAEAHQLPWREDASNLKTNYDRNKLRLDVIPKLKELNGSLEQTFLLTKERLDLQAELVAQMARQTLDQFFDAMDGKLDLSWVRVGSDILILNEILTPFGFNYVTVKEIFAAIGQPGKTFEASKYRVVMDRKSLFVGEIDQANTSELIIEKEGSYQVGTKNLKVSFCQVKDISKIVKQSSDQVAYLDVALPLAVRPWKQGDSIQPLGMSGSKKVSDLLIDVKVPLAKKQEVFVVLSQGEIAWVAGYKLSDKFKLSSGAQRFLRLELTG